jgi:hypothetical protein
MTFSTAVTRLSALSSTGAVAVVTAVAAVDVSSITVAAVSATVPTTVDTGLVTSAGRLGAAGRAGTTGNSLVAGATRETAEASGADTTDFAVAATCAVVRGLVLSKPASREPASSEGAVTVSPEAASADAAPQVIHARTMRAGSRSARRTAALTERKPLPIRITPQRGGRPEYARRPATSRGKKFVQERAGGNALKLKQKVL